jgi:hypothetical protein
MAGLNPIIPLALQDIKIQRMNFEYFKVLNDDIVSQGWGL